MNLKSVIRASLILAPTFLVINHDFFTIRRVQGNSLFPTFNPKSDISSSYLEDDYVLVKILGENYEPSEIKHKYVSIIKPDGSTSIRLVECIEGEWCPSPFGFTFVQSGHAWVKTYEDLGDSIPLASIEGVVDEIIWPPDRYGSVFKNDENLSL